MAVTSSLKKPLSPNSSIKESAETSKGKITEKRISVYANLAKS